MDGPAGTTLPGVWADPAPDTPLLWGTGIDPLTYGDARLHAARLAGALWEAGVRPGDRVALQVAKSPLPLLVYLACVRMGAVLLPMNPAYTDEEVAHIVADASPTVVIRDPGRAEVPLPGGRAAPLVLTTAADGDDSLPARAALSGEAGAGAPEVRPAGPSDLVAILYTSGTTGRPKGAMLTHRALASNAVALHRAWRFGPGDVLLHALPVFHTHGLFVAVNTVLVNGSGMIWLPRFDVDAVLEHLPLATVFMGVPTFYTRLLADRRLDRTVCRGMRLFTSGSAPLLASTHQAFLARTGHAIVERYGLTETNILTSNPVDAPRAGTVGLPLDGVELRVTAETEPSGSGDVGQVEVRGPGLAAGYWGRPDAWAAEHADDGWFRTGDLGSLDADGFLTLVGRSKDLIISGGLNVYPKEVESVIDAMDGVEESAVVGVPDDDFGEVVVAVVVARPDGPAPRTEDVRDECRRHLAPFKVPKRVEILGALPRNAMGKVEKARLRSDLSGPPG